MTMEGDKGGGGRVGVGEDDMGDGMQCSNHPYRANPGGICAFCLQEKLGKLVSSPSSSSFPLPILGLSSSSASFRSDTAAIAASSGNGVVGTTSSTSLSLSLSVLPTSTVTTNENGYNSHDQEYYTGRARIPFLLAKKKKKKKTIVVASSDHHRAADIFKRSKSTTTPRRGRFLDASVDDVGEDFSTRKRGGFWSFLYLSSKSHGTKCPDKIASIAATSVAATPPPPAVAPVGATATGSVLNPKEKCPGSSVSRKGSIVVVEDDDSCKSQDISSASSFERKVSRSRSVGCGSRSFSGDFFERISTGFGDCTLRRVESQREGKPKVAAAAAASSSAVKETVKCGLFGGFVLTSSSSSSSSSSYWVSNTAEDVNGKSMAGALVYGRNKSWGWAFTSPMRVFNKPSSSSGKKDTIIRESNNKNPAPNLAAIPSLLAVRV